MASMTPIRVRGKKTATEDEKWTTRTKRRRTQSPTTLQRGTGVSPGSSENEPAKRRKRRQIHPLSKLEQLPTEILQAIFVFSANPELPLSSPRLGSQLKGKHVHNEITSRVLGPLFRTATPASEAVVAKAARLMNCSFFTWPFFAAWLDAEKQARNFECFSDPTSICMQFFYNVDLLPPKKLLRAPFTKDKMQFLTAMNRARSSYARSNVPPLYREVAIAAAPQAIAEGLVDAVKELQEFCITPDTELFRIAVVDCGCEKDMVDCLIMGCISRVYPDIDYLDTTVWSWAENARAEGNEKGQWLMDRLKNANRGMYLL